jgi:hypothetical protein
MVQHIHIHVRDSKRTRRVKDAENFSNEFKEIASLIRTAKDKANSLKLKIRLDSPSTSSAIEFLEKELQSALNRCMTLNR